MMTAVRVGGNAIGRERSALDRSSFHLLSILRYKLSLYAEDGVANRSIQRMLSSVFNYLFKSRRQDPHLLFSDDCAICERERQQIEADNMGIMEAYRE
jgi:hypothetical protein